jgi:hypothetical protein
MPRIALPARSMVVVGALLILRATACCPAIKDDGCTRNSDCMGSQVCVASVCQARTSITPGPPTPPRSIGTPATVSPPAQNNHGVVRVGPSSVTAEVAQLPRNTPVMVIERSPDGLWRRITWTVQGGGEGWMHQDVLNETAHPRRVAPVVNPNKVFPCVSDGDCFAPYRCGSQGNCTSL